MGELPAAEEVEDGVGAAARKDTNTRVTRRAALNIIGYASDIRRRVGMVYIYIVSLLRTTSKPRWFNLKLYFSVQLVQDRLAWEKLHPQ